LTNEYGTQALHVGAAHIAVIDADGHTQPGSDHALSFGGLNATYVPAGAPMLTDPIDLTVAPLSSLSVSLYLPEETGPCTCHPAALQSMMVSGDGDFTGKDFSAAQTLQSRAFVSSVELETTQAPGTIVVFGDSISDGVGSTPDANHRWPDRLAARLAARRKSGAYGIANAGISGNRLLNDGAGQAALVRFDRDVLAVPGVTHVIVFEGINDIGLSYGKFEGPLAELFRKLAPVRKATARDLIDAYRQIIARAHAKGLKVIGATLTPYEGAGYYAPEGEEVRQAVNQWVRTGGAFDGLIDFDSVMRDPAHPTRITEGFHPGDHLHGTDAGYEAMANAVDLSLFK
jgi:lysophospholipase L1-like esterase